MKSATTASTEMPQPAIAMPVCPVGTNSDATPRRFASRSSSSPTVIFPIAQSEPTVSTMRAGSSRFSPVGTLRSGGGLRRSRSSTLCLRARSTSSVSLVRNSCRPFSTSSPFAMLERICSRNAGGKRPPAVATPTSAVVGLKQSASLTEPTMGKPSSVSPARSVSSSATTFSGAYRMTPRAVLPWCGSPLLPSARTRYFVSDTESRGRRRKLDAVDERDARPRVVGEEQVAVEVDVVAERREVRAGGDAESRLDHAAEHHAESERARGVRHSDRLADPTRLVQLDVDPVRALGALGDVGKRVAVLVDEDRNGRAALELGAVGVAGGERLLAVLKLELRQVLERLVERPVLVHVYLQRQVGNASHRADALDVEP